MARLIGPTQIYPESSWYVQQRAFYRFSTTDGSLPYVHMKTNVSGTSGQMWMVEAVGYAYGLAYPVRLNWNWYCVGGTIGNYGGVHVYSGTYSNGVYMSSDGYAVLRLQCSAPYYLGFVLNGYVTRTDLGQQIAILSAVQNNNSGAAY